MVTQRHRQACSSVDLTGGGYGPLQCRHGIGAFRASAQDELTLARSRPLFDHGFRPAKKAIPVTTAQLSGRAVVQPVGAVFTHGHELAVAHCLPVAFGEQDGLGHEAIQQVQNEIRDETIETADLLGGFQIETAGKD